MKKKYSYFIIFVILVFLVFLFGCSKKDSDSNKISKTNSKDIQTEQQIMTTKTAVETSKEKQLDKYKQIDEFSFLITDYPTFEYITLGGRDLESAKNEFKGGEAQTQSEAGEYADYQTDIIFNMKRYEDDDRMFNVKTLNFGEENSSDATQVIYYMGTNCSGTYRGIYVSCNESELLRIYPDDLYFLDINKAKEKAVRDLNSIDFDYAYAYMPLNGCDSDITFYLKDKEIVFIEMYSGLKGVRWKGCKTVYEKPDKPCEFIVETAWQYHLEVQTSLAEIYKDESPFKDDNDPIICKFDYKVPKIKETVPNAELINKGIRADSFIDKINKLQNGDFSIIYQDHIGTDSYAYEVYQYKNLKALVVTGSTYGVDWGGWSYALMWYFDCENGQLLSARQYANKVGISEKEIIKAFNDESELYDIDSVYVANFYIDADKRIKVYEDVSD